MNLGVFPIEFSAVVAVIGVLIGEHLHVLADGLCAFVLEAHSASGAVASIVVEGVLEGEILQVGALAGDEQCGSHADALVLHVGSVLDDGSVHALADDGNVVGIDGREHGLAQVVGAVGQEEGGAVALALALCHGRWSALPASTT